MHTLKTVTSVKELARERGWNYRVHHPEVTLWFHPSQTTIENFTEFANHAESWMHDWDARTLPGRTPHSRRSYGRLYAHDAYSIGESFSCELPEVFMVGHEGVLCTSEREILVESFINQGVVGTRAAFVQARPSLNDCPRLPGTYISLRAFAAANYCHWLLDCLPRVIMAQALNLNGDFKYILPSPLKPFHLDSLWLLGIPDEQLLTVEGSTTRIERLIMCLASPKTIRPLPAHLLALTTQIKNAALGAEIPIPHRRLYISRQNTTRLIVNEAELLPVLEEFGFEVVHSENMAFDEQVRLFAEASVVMGPHGAGMSNHVFSPPGTTVIELYHPHIWSDNVQRTVVLYGHHHWHLFGTPVGEPLRYDIRVDSDRLRSLLALACPN